MCGECRNGAIGRFEGCIIYCSCVDGLDAEMGDISRTLQKIAARLVELDALDVLGRLDARGRACRQEIHETFYRMSTEHDRIERAWTEARERGESVPVLV